MNQLEQNFITRNNHFKLQHLIDENMAIEYSNIAVHNDKSTS